MRQVAGSRHETFFSVSLCKRWGIYFFAPLFLLKKVIQLVAKWLLLQECHVVLKTASFHYELLSRHLCAAIELPAEPMEEFVLVALEPIKGVSSESINLLLIGESAWDMLHDLSRFETAVIEQIDHITLTLV